MTALHMAARHGHLEVIQFLLDAGAKLDSRDQMGANILHTAAEHGQVPGGWDESNVFNVSNACASGLSFWVSPCRRNCKRGSGCIKTCGIPFDPVRLKW